MLLAIQCLLTFMVVFIFFLQLVLGIAVVGWLGHFATVEREKSPGPYWFSISLQVSGFLIAMIAAIQYGWIDLRAVWPQ